MAKMWAGRTSGETAAIADAFNSSIAVDGRMFRQDIRGSMAHAAMLAKAGILTQSDADALRTGLAQILSDLESGALDIDPSAEDIHMFVEQVLTERLGAVGKKLHTARSRNDQVALDLRLYLLEASDELIALTRKVISAICDKAEEYKTAVMPGYTHLQRAQPILFAHQLLAYAWMLLRDIDRLEDGKKRIGVSPIGCCALAGTTYETDREFEAAELGLTELCMNSIDGVSDRDFCIEFLASLSIMAMHFSRLSEELIIWSTGEFGYITISDDFTTGSSIMPQKKNPDMAELARGKTGRVYGDLITMLTVMKGIPLAYDKDMQEDKEAVFDAFDTMELILKVMAPMLADMKVNEDAMAASARGGYMNATDVADYLVKKGMPFREAYKISGNIVHHCIARKCAPEELPLEEYKAFSELFDSDVFEAIDLAVCVDKRRSLGGTSPSNVQLQLQLIRAKL